MDHIRQPVIADPMSELELAQHKAECRKAAEAEHLQAYHARSQKARIARHNYRKLMAFAMLDVTASATYFALDNADVSISFKDEVGKIPLPKRTMKQIGKLLANQGIKL